ncbi:phosphonate ABC transporter substrate-binding protein [Pigmentiphaga soli]|uniref:Phosphonate ABC transporter substrate-binding protein n=2 Tax=Pigmentiphaga soli TaxID=1007095 RepID=A0ABP8HMI4_9BURK
MLWCAVAAAQQPALRFGILPNSDPLEARNEWAPVLAGMSRALGRAVEPLSLTSYDALEAALRRGDVDLALLSGQLALEAATRQSMVVLAQARHDDPGCCRSVLVARRDAMPGTLDQMLTMPGRWRLARGEQQSMAGYLVPWLQLFLPRHIRPESFFVSETEGYHQSNALAVANGEADLGITTSGDLERFSRRFPQEYRRLAVLWRSAQFPDAHLLARRDLPAPLLERLQAWLTAYGRTPGPGGDAERAALRQLRDFSGFTAADDTALLSTAQLVYQLARQSALQSRWVNDDALQARLRRVDRDYAGLTAMLEAEGGMPPMPARTQVPVVPVSDTRR